LKHDQVIQAIKQIKKGNLDGVEKFGKPLDVISSCIRGFICAPKGKELICADYASIEARLVLWLAGEKEAVAQMMEGRDIYRELAATIYKKDVDDVTKKERDNGKRGILGGGYGMGWKKQKETAAKYGAEISDELSKAIIDAYRSKYARVPLLWKALEKAAIDCVFHKKTTRVQGVDLDIRFKRKGRFLLLRLPSGRILTYYKPRLTYGKFDKLQLTYMGVFASTNKLVKKYMWGGVWTENIIQSLARDIMYYGMQQVEQTKKYDVLLNVYDEVLAECDKGAGDKKEFRSLLTRLEPWAQSAPIEIKLDDVWIGKRYRKG
jgi:DNA polymerase